MKIAVRALISALLAASLLAACGSEEEAVSSGSPADPEPTAQPDPDPEPPLGAGPYAVADITVTYNHPDTGEIVYQFACFGDTATLVGEVDGVDAIAACTAMTDAAVVDRLVNGSQDQVCTEQFGGPETAQITGTLEGQAVDTSVDRANGCGISDWDGLLSTLVPAPRPF